MQSTLKVSCYATATAIHLHNKERIQTFSENVGLHFQSLWSIENRKISYTALKETSWEKRFLCREMQRTKSREKSKKGGEVMLYNSH